MLEAKPASNAAMLVEAMIDVAITGLYTQVIADGLRLQAWREPELAAMQKQLQDIDLLPLLQRAMNTERAAVCRLYETTVLTQFKKWYAFDNGLQGLWTELKNPRYLLVRFAPHGWVCQNICAVALRDQLFIDSLDLPNNRILPRNTDGISNQVQNASSHFAPYTFLATIAVPNFVKASKTLARTQTLVNEAYIACGLERYRLAHGQYPETLEALVPQFAEKLPHDIIGGQPLKYHRTTDGRFVLYSIAWNEKDDGGVPSQTAIEGDWVWP
jgi:hypothetical protein